MFLFSTSFSVGDVVINKSLRLPLGYCREPEQPDHSTCVHATLHYDENFHEDDEVRQLKYSESFSIPVPEISYGIWKMLNDYRENRREDQENRFYVQWADATFNIVEVNTIRELAREFQRLKTDVKMEKKFLATHLKHPLPAGIIRLGEGDEDVFAVTEQILYANLFLKMDTPLSTIDRTIEDYTRMDNEQLFNFSHHDRQFSEDEIHCVLEILNNQEEGKDKYIVFTPELNNAKVCEEYASKKGVDVAEVVHVVLNINKGVVNLTEKNGHWVYCAIPHDKEIIYGDPLGSKSVPNNLMEVLNPIYRAKFGKDIVKNKVKINNVSTNPNFPLQTCSTICGLVSAVICIASFSGQLYNEIMFAKEENIALQFIRNPTAFCEQIRLRFLKVISSRKPCVEFFIPSQINFSSAKKNDDTSIRKSKLNAPNAWQSLISKSRTNSCVAASSKDSAHPTTSKHGPTTWTSTTSVPKRSNAKPSRAPSQSVSRAPSDVTDSTSTSSRQSSSHSVAAPTKPPSPQVVHQNKIKLIQPNYIGIKSFLTGIGFPENDGFPWKLIYGRKAKGARHFICSHENCTALKHVFKTKAEARKKT